VGGRQVERAGTDRAGRPRDEDLDGGSWPGLRAIVGSLPARAQRSATNGTFDDIPGGSGCREAEPAQEWATRATIAMRQAITTVDSMAKCTTCTPHWPKFDARLTVASTDAGWLSTGNLAAGRAMPPRSAPALGDQSRLTLVNVVRERFAILAGDDAGCRHPEFIGCVRDPR
jgi:hypothetical protein